MTEQDITRIPKDVVNAFVASYAGADKATRNAAALSLVQMCRQIAAVPELFGFLEALHPVGRHTQESAGVALGERLVIESLKQVGFIGAMPERKAVDFLIDAAIAAAKTGGDDSRKGAKQR